MQAYEVSQVPSRVWETSGVRQRVRGGEFNVAAWVQLKGTATQVLLVVEHEDDAGQHEALVDKATTNGDGALLMSGLVSLRFTGEVKNVKVSLVMAEQGVTFRVDELFMQRRGAALDQQDKLISNF
ncbi:MAG: hypothetical protein ACPG43_02750 [Alcanivoracaceae bacterium]